MSDVISVQDIPQYTRKDFVSDQTVRWCPGCGDYAILAAVQKVLPELGIRREDIVFISGIGCSSRFPYYMNTYGIHSIHGRAPTLATGLSITNPELSIWVITGDGDGLSIGGNHLLHTCRRNVNLNILLFNNRIYGLTKGQYSPTSQPGTKTKSSPMGSIDQAFNPVAVTLGAGATFIARTIDTATTHLAETIKAAALHKGASFVEILQNCVIFNDKTWEYVEDKAMQPETALFLKHGEPMIFGRNADKGIRLNGLRPEVVRLGNGITEADLLVHDETNQNLAYLLTQMDYPEYPVPVGVIYRIQKQTYAEAILEQVHIAQQQRGRGDLHKLYHSDYTWTVEGDRVSGIGAETDELMSGLDEEYLDIMRRRLAGISEDGGTTHESLSTDLIVNLLHPDRELITIAPTTTLAEAIRLMQEKDMGALLVVDANRRPIGIFTETDILQKVAIQVEDLNTRIVADFMTRDPDTLRVDLPISHALHLMAVHHYRHVPIVDEHDIVLDIVSFRDVVRYIETHFLEFE